MDTRHVDPHAGEKPRTQPIVGLVVVAAGLSLAYYAWPSEVVDVPLASLTFDLINQAMYAVCLALMALFIAKSLSH